jgi:hypothetical protein
MSLADRSPKGPRILTIDLERLPGEVELDVWEPRDFKRLNYVHPDRWKKLPQTLCWSAQWYGEDRMMFSALWHKGGYEAMIWRAWHLLNLADIVVGYNSRQADEKWLRSDFVTLGIGPPSPYKSVDLYVVARREFSFESKSLRHLCDRLGIENKDGHYSAQEAKAAAAGNRPAQSRMRAYNGQDVRVTEQAYDRLGAYIREHPHYGIYTGTERCCFRCGSENLVQDKSKPYTATAMTQYALLRCADCGAWTRLNHRRHNVTTRAAR